VDSSCSRLLYSRSNFPTTHNLFYDWYNFTFSLIFFISGYLITAVEGVWDVIIAQRKKSLIVALIPSLFLILFVYGPTFYIMNEETELFSLFYGVLKITLVTFILYAIFGYGYVLLNKSSKVLSYLNESVYPLYILYKSVQLTIGYYILQLNLEILPKFRMVVIGTFGISFLIY
jgi:glucans biosynthesis protein C